MYHYRCGLGEPIGNPEAGGGHMGESVATILEERLIAGLQPIRGFVLAQALYHFMGTGLQASLSTSSSTTISALSRVRGLNDERVRGLLQYLANEGFVEFVDGDRVILTGRGEEIADFQPWYTLLVGGYAQTFIQLSEVLKAGAPYATRDATRVGIGSCGISQYDALPMTRRLLAKIPRRPGTVIDLGCGDGGYLLDLCRSLPDIRGIGLEPNHESVGAANEAAVRLGVSDRVEARVGSATDLPDFEQEPGPLCFITAFVLQEILEQSGAAAIIELLASTFERYPDAHWIVVEVDDRASDPSVMQTGLGLGYYNPYYLIHHLTQQRLEQIAFWERLYREAGLRVLAYEYPDPTYDSLRLKVGCLLSK